MHFNNSMTAPASSISASNLFDFDPMISPTNMAEIEGSSSHSRLPSTLEKRKHAEDESPQSPPPAPLTGKRNRSDNEEQPPKEIHGICACKFKAAECEGSGCKGSGGGRWGEPSVPELSEFAKNYFRDLEARGIKINVGHHSEDDEELGDMGLFLGEFDPNREDPSDCCRNPFAPLVFKESPKLYNEMKAFCLKEVDHFNKIYKQRWIFEDIETVTSCNAACQHHVLTIKVKDPSNYISVIIIRGKVRKGFPEAKVEDFVLLYSSRA